MLGRIVDEEGPVDKKFDSINNKGVVHVDFCSNDGCAFESSHMTNSWGSSSCDAAWHRLEEMAEVDVDSVAMVTYTIPPQGPAQKKRKRQSRWGPPPSA